MIVLSTNLKLNVRCKGSKTVNIGRQREKNLTISRLITSRSSHFFWRQMKQKMPAFLGNWSTTQVCVCVTIPLFKAYCSMYFFDAGNTVAQPIERFELVIYGKSLSGFLSCVGWSERIDVPGIKKCQAVLQRVRVRAFKHLSISKSVVANVSEVVILQTMFTAFYASNGGRFTKRRNVCIAHAKTLAGAGGVCLEGWCDGGLVRSAVHFLKLQVSHS